MRPTSSTTELQGLLAACQQAPDDDTPRLVLADWLEEHGEQERGDFIRVQVQRARLPAWDQRQAGLARREAVLLRRHGWEWQRPLAGQCAEQTFHRGLLTIHCREPVIDSEGAGSDPAWAWVDGVSFEHQASPAELADPRFGAITRFRFHDLIIPGPPIRKRGDKAMQQLAGSPAARRLTALEVQSSYCSSAGLVTLLSPMNFPALRRLVLDYTCVSADGLEPLAALEHPSLEEIRLYGAELGEPGGEILAGSPLLDRLRWLELIVTKLSTRGFLAVFRSPRLSRLEHLHFSSERMTVGGIQALEGLPKLRSLALRECQLKASAARALARSPLLGRLECLDFCHNHLDDEAIAVLAASPHLGSLRELNLGDNRLFSGAAASLAGSPLAELGKLDLSCNTLRDEEFRVLAAWLARQRLVSLNLGSTFPSAWGLRSLTDCPGLDNLVELNLENCMLGQTDGATVLASAHWLNGVVILNLRATGIAAEGLQDLLDSARLGMVTDLNLARCRLEDRGARLLADWPGLAGLLRLDLSDNSISDEGAKALAASPHLPPGLRLDLTANGISEPVCARLRERLGNRVNFLQAD
jgi:uncharacterized protein (TIGR02996 family)